MALLPARPCVLALMSPSARGLSTPPSKARLHHSRAPLVSPGRPSWGLSAKAISGCSCRVPGNNGEPVRDSSGRGWRLPCGGSARPSSLCAESWPPAGCRGGGGVLGGPWRPTLPDSSVAGAGQVHGDRPRSDRPEAAGRIHNL